MIDIIRRHFPKISNLVRRDALDRLKVLLNPAFGDRYETRVDLIINTNICKSISLCDELNELEICVLAPEDIANLITVFLTVIKNMSVTKYVNFEEVAKKVGLTKERVNKVFLEDFYRKFNPLSDNAMQLVACMCSEFKDLEAGPLTERCYIQLQHSLGVNFSRQQVYDQVRSNLKGKKDRPSQFEPLTEEMLSEFNDICRVVRKAM